MDRLGIEFITVLGQDPVAYVHLAADLGMPRIGLALTPVSVASEATPLWSLREDAELRKDVATALAEREVTVMLGEGFLIHPQMDIAKAAGDLDLLAGLGAERVNLVSLETERTRGNDQFALFAEMASARGMRATIEFMPGVGVGTLGSALACVEASGNPAAGVLVDAMHFFRSGGTIAELAAVDPARIGHAQLCDAPKVPTIASYADEARYERLAPGEGELPLRDFIAALPSGIPLGLEVPQRAKALCGIDHRARLADIVAATRSCAGDLL